MKEIHSPLHPICAILITYKNGDTERNEFGSHAAKAQRMMHLRWDLVDSVKEVNIDSDSWEKLGDVTKRVIDKMGKKCRETK